MSNITGNEDINGAILSAMAYCWDETHGYTLGGNMNPDTDCSGLVWQALHDNGFDVGSYRWNTGTMINILRAYGGFEEHIYNSSFQLQHGDICVHREEEVEHGHACMIAQNVLAYTANVWNYSGNMANYPDTTGVVNLAKIEAYSNRGHPANGDQANNAGAHCEVFVHSFEGLSSSYQWRIFRWTGSPSPTPHALPLWLMMHMSIPEYIKHGAKKHYE